MKKRQSDLHFVFQETAPLFLPYSVFLPPTPGGLQRRTYQSSVPENQYTAQIQYSVV